MADPALVRRNAEERERLEALLDRLDEATAARMFTDQWTIAASLAHVAFWDRRAAVLFGKWATEPVTLIPIEAQTTNDALLDEWLALPWPAVRRLAIEAARAADAAVERCSDEIIAAAHASGSDVAAARYEHRGEHLDQLDELLAKQG
jgi:hypothetical protein